MMIRIAILSLLAAALSQESKELLEQFKGAKAELLQVEADAGVQAGAKKDVNLGRNEILEVKDFEDTPQSGWVLQRVYLRFKLAGLKAADVKGAHLAVFGNLGDGDKPVDVDVAVLADKDDGWDETKITWNTQPGPANAKAVGKLTFTYGNTPTRATEGRWYKTADIGDALRAKLTKGDGVISFLLTTKIKEEACLFTKEHKKAAECGPRLVILRGKA